MKKSFLLTVIACSICAQLFAQTFKKQQEQPQRWYFPKESGLFNLRGELSPEEPYGKTGYICPTQEQLEKTIEIYHRQLNEYHKTPEKFGHKVPSMIRAAESAKEHGIIEDSLEFAYYLTWTRWSWSVLSSRQNTSYGQ
ncbi:MAG: hypothetical protein IJ764_02760 [Bacteroidales bacterium]|nr:hypothetical protein [Bacteroidales bacterium]